MAISVRIVEPIQFDLQKAAAGAPRTKESPSKIVDEIDTYQLLPLRDTVRFTCVDHPQESVMTNVTG